MKTIFADPDDILNFVLEITPDEGIYHGGRFTFTFTMGPNYPHEPPKVRCQQKIYHPNIDLEGKVCLNILREDWKPVLNLNAVIVGMQVFLLSLFFCGFGWFGGLVELLLGVEWIGHCIRSGVLQKLNVFGNVGL